MTEHLKAFAEWCAAGIEAVGIVIISGSALYVLVVAAIGLIRRAETANLTTDLRRHLGRGILLGLEFLVAADIIHTVAVELSYESVAVLAAIVLIRTFLSFALEVELNGRWPWQKPAE